MSFRNSSGVLNAILVCAFSGCGGSSPPNAVLPAQATSPHPVSSCPASIDYDRKLEALRAQYTDRHPAVIALRESIEHICSASHGAEPVKWQRYAGSRFCDGYMTRNAANEYCSADVPDGWVGFSFNGQQFYFQPLHAVGDE